MNSETIANQFARMGARFAGAGSGNVRFFDTATADRATLYAEAGVGAAPGGVIYFDDTSDDGTARAILEGGAGLSPGGLDISLLDDSGMGQARRIAVFLARGHVVSF